MTRQPPIAESIDRETVRPVARAAILAAVNALTSRIGPDHRGEMSSLPRDEFPSRPGCDRAGIISLLSPPILEQ
jgi:hypothetical protein